jgi:DUF1680 family protein
MYYNEIGRSHVEVSEKIIDEKRRENRRYLLSLDSDALLLSYRGEAALDGGPFLDTGKIHGGWEFPTCQLRGHFLGHWLSAAAMYSASLGDLEMKARADAIVEELARCQKANGGEWAASIPEKYLALIAGGKKVWAPHYTIHKTGEIWTPKNGSCRALNQDFFCCYGTLVQANASLNRGIYYLSAGGPLVAVAVKTFSVLVIFR